MAGSFVWLALAASIGNSAVAFGAAGGSRGRGNRGSGNSGNGADGTCNNGDDHFVCPGAAADFLAYRGLKGGKHHWDVMNPLKDGISFMAWGPCDNGAHVDVCAGRA